MNREKKEKLVGEIKHLLKANDSFYMVDFKNMKADHSTELRKVFKKNSFAMRVIKNRLALRAMEKSLPESIRGQFQGPTALVFASENPIQLARLIKDFSTQKKVLSVKGGILEGQAFNADRFEEIVRLTSRADLLAKFGGLLGYPFMRLARTWQAPLNQLGRMLSQLKSNKS